MPDAESKRPATLVAASGWGRDADRERSRAVGCDVHLVTPVALDDLEEALAAAPGVVS